MVGLHLEAAIKLRNYHVVVQFVPLSFKPNKDDGLWEVEESNGMKTGVIQRARWIKPISRQSPTQTCSHVILLFLSPDTANEVLAHGLFICQKKVYVEKCKRSPLLPQMPQLGVPGPQLFGCLRHVWNLHTAPQDRHLQEHSLATLCFM